MNALFYLIDQLALGLYFLLAAALLRNLWVLMRNQQQVRATYFDLERNLARYRQVNALTWMILAVEMGALILGIQQRVVPYLRAEDSLSQVAANVRVSDGDYRTATPAPVAAGGLDIEPVEPLGENDTILLLTPTLTPTPVGTIIPNAPAPQGCSDDRARLNVPANGMRVFQPIEVIGTAFSENFSLAKVEISGPGTNGAYAVIDDKRQETRTTSAFSQFVPAPYPPGEYQFRVTVFDTTLTLVASCMVTIYITEPPTTPTPTAQP